jgi:hypothetical protein
MAKNPDEKKESKKRYSIDLNEASAALLENVKNKSKAQTVAETLRKAMAFYDMLLDHQAAGGKVIFANPDGTQETVKIV